MSNYICNIRCSYRQPSGYCGLTSGYETCQFRQIHQPNTAIGYIPPIKKTNADKIRSMTDEELANFLMDVASRGGIQTESGIARWTLIDWLKQEIVKE